MPPPGPGFRQMAEALKEAGLTGSGSGYSGERCSGPAPAGGRAGRIEGGWIGRGEDGRVGQYADTFSNSSPQMAAYRVAVQQAESTAHAYAARTAREQAAARDVGYNGPNRPSRYSGSGGRGPVPAGGQKAEKPSRTAMQDEYLKKLSESGTPVQVICFEGYQFVGFIKGVDTYGILIASEDGDDLLFKHGIIAIRPARIVEPDPEPVKEPTEGLSEEPVAAPVDS